MPLRTSKQAYLISCIDILELEKVAKKDYPKSPFRKLISLIFINARIL